MRVGLYGGGFDPIHNGHLRPVWEAKRVLALDRVIYLPTACPPHKVNRMVASAAARYAMVELALLWETGLFASPFELGESAPSYTIDTIRHFCGAHPADTFVLLVGSDAFAGFAGWREWEEILRTVEVAVLQRPGWPLETLSAKLPEALRAAAFDQPLGHPVRLVPNRPLPASSTDIRAHLGAGSDLPPGLVPSLVLDYIRKYELYR